MAKEIAHPSHGLIRVSRAQGHKRLFGSDLTHEGFVSISIYPAALERDLNYDRYVQAYDSRMKNKPIIEVDMSELQYSQMITTMNFNEGTPCTIVHTREDGDIELEAEEPKRNVFDREIRDKCRQAAKDIDAINNVVEAQNISQKAKAAIKHAIYMASMQVASNLPHIETMFAEHLDKKTTHAMSTIEGFLTNSIMMAGFESIRTQNRIGSSELMLESGDTIIEGELSNSDPEEA